MRTPSVLGLTVRLAEFGLSLSSGRVQAARLRQMPAERPVREKDLLNCIHQGSRNHRLRSQPWKRETKIIASSQRRCRIRRAADLATWLCCYSTALIGTCSELMEAESSKPPILIGLRLGRCVSPAITRRRCPVCPRVTICSVGPGISYGGHGGRSRRGRTTSPRTSE